MILLSFRNVIMTFNNECTFIVKCQHDIWSQINIQNYSWLNDKCNNPQPQRTDFLDFFIIAWNYDNAAGTNNYEKSQKYVCFRYRLSY